MTVAELIIALQGMGHGVLNEQVMISVPGSNPIFEVMCIAGGGHDNRRPVYIIGARK